MKAYSQDIRLRILQAVDVGQSKAAMAQAHAALERLRRLDEPDQHLGGHAG